MPDLKHAFLIASREYLENVRTRGFWLSLLMLPIILALLSIAPVLLSDTASQSGYAVIDQSGWLNREVQLKVLHEDLRTLLIAWRQNPPPDDLSDIDPDDGAGRDALVEGAAAGSVPSSSAAVMTADAHRPVIFPALGKAPRRFSRQTAV